MRIAIDISQGIYGTGVSLYTRNIVAALLSVDNKNKYLLYGGSLRRMSELKTLANSFNGKYTTKILAYPPTFADLVWNKLHILPIEKIIGEFDVVHTSDWSEPPSNYPKVTTVHDLYPFRFPKMVHPKILETHKRKMSWVLQESKQIIVPSRSTKNDLIKIGAESEIINVIPEAPNVSKATLNEVSEVKSKYKIRGDYIIAVGVTPLKNTKRIIEAFLKSRPGKDIKLVVVGRPVSTKVNDQRNVRFVGHIDDNDYRALITGARVLVFASLYEGFGLPILDAFNCGVPVVTSDEGSMPEVAGDAAILVDPKDITSIAEGISKALKGPKGLIDKGSERVKEFSWKKSAEETIKVYKKAVLI